MADVPEQATETVLAQVLAKARAFVRDVRVRLGVGALLVALLLWWGVPRLLFSAETRAGWEYLELVEDLEAGKPGSATALRDFLEAGVAGLESQAIRDLRRDGTLLLARSALRGAGLSGKVQDLIATAGLIEQCWKRGVETDIVAGLMHALGLLYLDAGRADDAIGLILDAPLRFPGYEERAPHYFRDLARAWLAVRQPDRGKALRAMNRFLEHVALESPPEELFFQKGELFYRVGDFRSARENLIAYLSLVAGPGRSRAEQVLVRPAEPRLPLAAYLIGRCSFGLGDFDRAIEDFGALVLDSVRDELDYQSLFFAGECHRGMGRWDEAFKHYNWVFGVGAPDWIDFAARVRLAELAAKQGRGEDSVQRYLEAISLDGDFKLEPLDRDFIQSVRRDLIAGVSLPPLAETQVVGGLVPRAAELRLAGRPLEALRIYEALARYEWQETPRDSYLFEIRGIRRALADAAAIAHEEREALAHARAGAVALLSMPGLGIDSPRRREAEFQAAQDLSDFEAATEAIRVLRGFLSGSIEDPRESQARQLLAWNLAKLGLLELALQEYDANARKFPEGPFRGRSLVEAADLIARHGAWLLGRPGASEPERLEGEALLARARDRFRALVFDDPTLSPRSRWWQRALAGLALVQDRIGGREEAASLLETALDRYSDGTDDPDDPWLGRRRFVLEYRLAVRAAREGRFDEAARRFQSSFELSPEVPAAEDYRVLARYGLADAFYALGQHPRAAAIYKAAADTSYSRSLTVWAYFRIGHCRRRLGEHGEARLAFRRAREVMSALPPEEKAYPPAGLAVEEWEELLAWSEGLLPGGSS